MKKLFLFALVTIMSLAANAQVVKSPARKFVAANDFTGPMRALSLSGCDKWGYHVSSQPDYQGIGFNGQTAGRFDVAIYVPGNSLLTGAKIYGVAAPGFADNVSNIKGWVASTLGGTKIAEANYTGTYVDFGFNNIAFDEPIEIPSTGLYVGYSFDLKVQTQYDSYPFACVQDGAEGSMYVGTDYANFQDLASYGYTSAMYIYVKDLNLTEHGASIASVYAPACAINGKGQVDVTLVSNCNNAIESVDYTLVVNGVETTGTATLSSAIPAGMNKSGIATIEFDAPSEIGAFPASVAITKVNGVDNEESTNAVEFTVSTVSRVVPRMTVVEEFTGTDCGYCPRGWVGMEAVKNIQSDKALVIAWHRYNNSDPMYVANYASINFGGAPQCTVDRKIFPDPYYGENEEGILECVNKFNKETATVDIKLKANFEDDTNKKVVVTSDTEFLTNTKGYTIAFVLTADELAGTTSAWKQANYYYQYTTAQAGVMESMPDLAKFCRGGEYGKSSVALTFNDAMIGSSYSSAGKTLVPAFATGNVGDVETSEYTLTMPTKSALVNALNYDKIYVTALVIDNNGNIANAARVRVLGAGEVNPGTGDVIEIEGMKISDRSETVQVMGENMSSNAKYVVGANFATYAPVVWNVETGDVKDYAEYAEGAFHAATSNGIAVGDDGNYAIKADANGNVTKLYYEEGETVETEWGPVSTGDAGSSAYAISEDGKTIAGFYFKSDYSTYPCLWNENNERIELPLPTSDEAGFEVNGGEVRWMTPDAKVLAGVLIDNMATWPACIWRQNAQGGYDVDIISKNFWEEGYQQGKPYMVFTPSGLSENGEWLALSVQREYDDWDFSVPAPTVQIARLNITTGAIEVLEVEEAYAPTGIANDGTMLAYTGKDMVGRVGYIWPARKQDVVCLNDVINDAAKEFDLASNTPCAISADGKLIQGFAMDNTEEMNIFSYVLSYDPTTGIENVTLNKVQGISADKIYNINGQQVKNMNRRGLYIINGKKVIK